MSSLSAVLVFLLAGAASGTGRPCVPSRPEARVRVSFLADSDLESLAKWARATTCVEYSFAPTLAGRRLAQGVILTVAGRDVRAIFEILLHTMNLQASGHGAKRTIVAAGPETAQSRAANAREKADIERDKVLDNLDAEIKRKDESHYTITRRGADAIMSNLPSIARSLRVTSETKGGKRLGFRLVSLKPGAILSRVGFHAGDVVVSLNGHHLASPDKALEAYTEFRTTSVMRAGFLRSNRHLTVEIKVE
jgi:hypothetical protein